MQPAPMTSPKELTWCPGSPTTPARLDSYTARLPSRRTTSIPTWTQDFSKLDAGLLHMVENPRNRAASSYSFVCSLSRGLGNILTVLGRRIDVVAAVAPHFPFGDFTRRPYEHVAHSIKTLLTPDLAVDVGSGIGGAKYGPTGEHLHTAAWKALFQHVSSGEGTEAAAQRKAEMGFAAIQWITMGFRTDVEAFVEDWKVREAAEGKGAHAELADKPIVVVGAEASKDKKSDNDGNYEDNGDEHEDGNTCRNEGFFDVRRAMHIIAPLVPSHLPSPSPSSDLTIPPAVTDKQSPLLPTITDLLEHTADGVLGWIMADSMRVIRTRGGPKSNGGGRSGWFGSAMPGVRPGDEVWLIRGCSLPLVLRPPDSDEDKAELEDGEEAEDELRNEYQ